MQAHTTPNRTPSAAESVEIIDDHEKGLHLTLHRNYASGSDWFGTIVEHARWYRVKYKSARFEKECETPCWTTFYGGRDEYEPYEPVPSWLRPLVDEVSSHLGVPFNAVLLRLYFDGNDEIAWHTDGRTFLGDAPTIASLSFGADCQFQMRRMLNVWPPTDGSAGDCIDRDTPRRDFVVRDGDLIVMRGATQRHWHHRVPRQRGRRPRLNINFRYILPGPGAERGQRTYYKYMVHGDEEDPAALTFNQIMDRRGGLMKFASPVRVVDDKPPVSLSGSGDKATASCCNKIKEIQVDRVLLAERPSPASKSPTRLESMHDDNSSVSNEPSTQWDRDVCAYMKSRREVDLSTFLVLPACVQKELVEEWKATQKQWKKRLANGDIVKSTGKAKVQRTSGQNTLIEYFAKKVSNK